MRYAAIGPVAGRAPDLNEAIEYAQRGHHSLENKPLFATRMAQTLHAHGHVYCLNGQAQ